MVHAPFTLILFEAGFLHDNGSSHPDRSRHFIGNYHSGSSCNLADSRHRAFNHHRSGSCLSSRCHLLGSGRGSVTGLVLCRSVGRLSKLGPVVVISTVLA